MVPQFLANQFLNYNDIEATFIQQFQSAKSTGKIINTSSHVKQTNHKY